MDRSGKIGQIHPDESVLCAAGVRNIRSTVYAAHRSISLPLPLLPFSLSAPFEAE